MSPDDLAFEPVGRIGALLRAGTVSCRELVDTCLGRIDRLGARLNAFVHVAGEQARTEAERLDRELGAGRDRGPLHGIPIAVKDIIDVAGMPTSCGTGGYDPTPVARDAAFVGALRKAGAVVLGKSNTHEFAYAAFHPDFGYARNPWDPSRTAGGAGIVGMELPEVLGANDAMMDILLPEILVIHESRLRPHRADYAPATLAEIERGAGVPATAYVKARRFRASLAARLHLAMDEARLDGLLCPSAPWPAPADLQAANDEEMLLEGVCATPFSVSGIPAISLPCGLAEDELPAGLQLAGRAGGDRDVLVMAACIEASLGRRIPERPPDCR